VNVPGSTSTNPGVNALGSTSTFAATILAH
jgi:hypothetical protein